MISIKRPQKKFSFPQTLYLICIWLLNVFVHIFKALPHPYHVEAITSLRAMLGVNKLLI